MANESLPIVKNHLRELFTHFLEYLPKESEFWIKRMWEEDEEYERSTREKKEEERDEKLQREIVFKVILGFASPKVFWPTGEGDDEALEWLCEKVGTLDNRHFREVWKQIWVYSFEADIHMPKKCEEMMKELTSLPPRIW